MFQSLPAVLRAASCAVFALSVLTSVSAQASETVVVSIDRAKIIKAPEGAHTLIIGNPLVADVTMLKASGSMVITGLSFGATNLIALDSAGSIVVEATIKVTGNEQTLTVLRGGAQETYSCSPRCAPTVALGDNQAFMNSNLASSKSRIGSGAGGGAGAQ